jgi:hypothetical protein
MIVDVHQNTRKPTTTIADNSRNVAGHGHSRAGVNALIQRGKTEVRGRGRARGGIRINAGRGCGNSNCPTTTLPSNNQDEVEETDRLTWSGKDPAQYANNEENAKDGKVLYWFKESRTNLLLATYKPLENKFAGHHQPMQMWEKNSWHTTRKRCKRCQVQGLKCVRSVSQKRKSKTWERPARKKKKVWGKPLEEKKKLESKT